MLAATAGEDTARVIGGLIPGALCLGVSIWAIADAARRPLWAWERSGSSKKTWILLVALTIPLLLISTILAVVYLVGIRPKVRSAQEDGAAPWPARPAAGGQWSAPGPAQAAPPSTSPAAWLADPRGRHEVRWWDGARWTDRVADAGVSSTDPV